MAIRMLTEMECDSCKGCITAPARKRLAGGFKPAKYPSSWREINGDMCCEDCTKKISEAIEKTKLECRKNNTGQQRRNTTPSSTKKTTKRGKR